jgi:hypothetical protein
MAVSETSPELERFLTATDLDDLQEARGEIKVISREAAAALTELVTAWDDEQALANLLMYPEVIPAPQRVFALLRALMTAPTHYLLLASLVGLRRVEMPREHRLAVSQRLRDLAGGEPGTVADLAATTLDEGDEPPLLAYIPNLAEWPAPVAPAPYPS